MATLVFSTVGTLLGGPVGGAIGSLLGQSVDQQLFGPGPREGPRLGDLAVQTSSYGTPIPRIFGTMRVAGCIVWSTDLQEDSATEGAKGQPDTVTYSYSASFAVALSSRPIGAIRRIWADGKLIRNAAGEFTVSTGFRLHRGAEDQDIDPLIASIEGIDSTPAYRGVALAVFENLQLAEFGNRIPFLTFEVEADPEAVPIVTILKEVSGGAIDSTASAEVTGYAAHGQTITAAIRPLVDIFGVPLADNGVQIGSPPPDLAMTAEEELGCSADGTLRPRVERTQVPARNLPSALSINYYDPAREYQAGLARAAIESTAAAADEKLELPAVIQATAAKALAETSIGRRWAERDKLTLRLPPTYLRAHPGTLLRPPGQSDPWRVERITVDSMIAVVELRPLYASVDEVPADPGRALPSLGVAPTPTEMAVFELPDDGTGGSNSPVIAVAASTSGGARTVPILVEASGLQLETRNLSARALLGTTQTVLAVGQSSALDLLNSVDVELGGAEGWLESCDDEALANGANLAIVGNELVQFGKALPLEPGRFRLSRLLRGRRGSEWAMSFHQIGERFVLLDRSQLQQLHLGSDHRGAEIRVRPLGLADSADQEVSATVLGEAMRPPSPVHLRARVTPDGALRCTWVRRSRHGWAWLDGVDAPLGCSTELYRITLRGTEGVISRETSAQVAEFNSLDLAPFADDAVEVSVMQIGDLAISRPASVIINTS